jgi:peroxiredoxin
MSLIGKPVPATNLYGPDRKPFPLEGLRGSKVVLAFVPGAFTGVCEKEMCTFRDSMAELNGLNAKVVGVSVDSPFANAGFAAKNHLDFPLLSDYTRDTTRAFGIIWPNFAGLPGYEAANRAVFVLDERGVVTYEWVAPNPGVEPDYAAIKAALG